MLNLEGCNSISDICKKLGGNPTGCNRRKVKRILMAEGIDPDEGLNSKKEEKKKAELENIKQVRSRGSGSNKAEQIGALREQGFTFKEIAEKVGCSKATVSYGCDPTQKQKIADRKEEYGGKNILSHRASNFRAERKNNGFNTERISDGRQCLSDRVRDGRYRVKNRNMAEGGMNDVINKFGMHPKCYLTGEELDFENPDSYSFDHILPVSRGGTNDLDNLGVTTPLLNMCKSYCTEDEFLDICEKVLRYHGKL